MSKCKPVFASIPVGTVCINASDFADLHKRLAISELGRQKRFLEIAELKAEVADLKAQLDHYEKFFEDESYCRSRFEDWEAKNYAVPET